MNKDKINILLSTLNFVLCFVGFQFATSIFLPAVSDMENITRIVTIPYRAFALLISLIVLILNFKNRIHKPISLNIFLFFWLILIFRLIYDVFIRTDVNIVDTSQLWLYVFGICLPAVFSIMKSSKKIDLDIAFRFIFILTGLILMLTLFTNQLLLVNPDNLDERMDANLAIGTIDFGHLGVTAIILGIFVLLNKETTKFQKFLLFIFVFLGMFSALRAGSRGPILAFFLVFSFWFFASSKNIVTSIFKLLLVGIFLMIFIDQLLNLMGHISPIIEDRLKMSIYEGDTSERNPLFQSALAEFIKNPLFGTQFALLESDGSFIYSHNIVLDALMGMGIIGGLSITFILGSALKKSYYLIKSKDDHFWIALLLIQQIVFNFLSGAFYYNQLLSALLVFLFLYYKQDKND